MKVRIGIAVGQWPIKRPDPEAIFELVDDFEALDVDSLWVSDRLVSTGLILEPVTFLSYLAGRLRKMKLGTSTLVLPVVSGDRTRRRRIQGFTGCRREQKRARWTRR
jgi:hypothetical protein